MCNPKPGSRCVTDTQKPYDTSLEKFQDLAAKLLDADGDEITDNYTDVEYDAAMEKLQDLADDLNTKKIFFAAALVKSEGGLDDDPKKALLAERKVTQYLNSKESVLSADADKFLNDNYKMGNRQVVETALYLNRFQAEADADRKEKGKYGNQLRTARHMLQFGVDSVHARLQRDLDANRDATLATDKKGMNPETVMNSHKQDSIALSRAAELARADALGVLNRDIKKNSFEQDWQETNMRKEVFKKRYDGAYDVIVTQKIKAPNKETAIRRNLESFDLAPNGMTKQNLNVTYEQSETEPDVYEVKTKYFWGRGETLPEVLSFQGKLWKGTPEARKKKR
jgi:hypothetical protein